MSHASMLPTNNSVPIENVVVNESGDDSEDEWDYFKGDKAKPEEQNLETSVTLQSEPEKDHLKEEDISLPTSPPPPPTTATFGATEFISQQSHALAQAIAQPEEACTELADEKSDQQTEHRDLFDLERAERSSSVAAEHDSDLGNDQDLEEMDSQLNPDAKEFVPVSPQRTAMSSPFGNGGLHNRIDLMDDDVVSQSPRKGSAIVMDDNDIELPAENDFTEISKRPSELLANEISNENDVQEADNVDLLDNDVQRDVQRPESSNSQCSYQEMNLKEAMHGDEKQELAAEMHESDNLLFGNGDDIVPVTNGGQQFLNEQNPMNMSFYNDENNPFNSSDVDMNAVQQLPDDIEDDENEMSDYVARPIENSQEQEHEHEHEHLQQEQQQQLQQQPNFMEHGENEPNSNQQSNLLQQSAEESTPITNFVQALATEVTSILNEVEQQGSENQKMEFSQVNQSEDVINDSALSISANEFVPSSPVVDVGFEAINSSAIDEPEQQLEPYLSTDQNQHQIELHGIAHGEPLLAIDPPTAHSIEEIIPQQQTECELTMAQATEPEPQSVITSSISDDKDTVADAPAELTTAGAAAVVAAAGAALVTVGIAKAASPKAKPSDAKKVDSKLKAAPIKKTATTTTTTATSKVAAARTSASKMDDKSKTAAPKIASRIVASKVSTTADKKPTVTSTITRKPTSNGTGVTSTIAKKTTSTTTSAVTKTSARPITASKPTPRTVSATTAAAKTVSKVSSTAAPRVPLSARTMSKPSTSTTATSKLTTTLSKTATSTVSATSRPKTATATSATSRATTLNKPKTAVSDKLSVPKSTVSKVSPTKPLTTTAAAKSPATRTSLGASLTKTTGTARLTPTRKPLSTASKVTSNKSPKVPATNGAVSKAKSVAKNTVAATAAVGVDKAKATTNGDAPINGHIEANGTGAAEKIIDVSAD